MSQRTSDIVLKEVSQTLQDKTTLTKLKEGLEQRIMLKLKTLGVQGTTYSEIVVRMSGIRDKFADVYSKVEELIERRDVADQELTIIENTLKEVTTKMKEAKSLEYKVFTGIAIDGLTLQQIADKEHYGIDRVKQVSAQLSKKFKCQ